MSHIINFDNLHDSQPVTVKIVGADSGSVTMDIYPNPRKDGQQPTMVLELGLADAMQLHCELLHSLLHSVDIPQPKQGAARWTD